MKHFFYSIVLLVALWPTMLMGQSAPDNDAIFRASIDQGSPYYYPPLMLRYMHGDTTLTLEDYHYLYYGYAYQPEYKPLEPITAADRLLDVLARHPEPDSAAAAEIIVQAREVMKSDPFSPANLNFMTYAYGLLGDKEQERLSADRFRKVTATILASGDGLSEKTPWHVLSFSHITDIIDQMQLRTKKPMIVSRSVEFVPLLVRNGKVKGYYFDYSRVYWKKPENLPTKRVDGFEINGIKVK